jgi:hypothetical protein
VAAHSCLLGGIRTVARHAHVALAIGDWAFPFVRLVLRFAGDAVRVAGPGGRPVRAAIHVLRAGPWFELLPELD